MTEAERTARIAELERCCTCEGGIWRCKNCQDAARLRAEGRAEG